MNQLFEDLHFGVRSLVRNPTVTVASCLSLALGIGAVTVVFSIANTLLFQPIPGVDSTRLYRVEGVSARSPVLVASYPEYTALQEGVPAFESLAAERINSTALSIDGSAISVGAAVVSNDYFATLGVELQRGPGFGGATTGGGPPVPTVVISDGLWRTALGEDPRVVGRPVCINGVDFTISGVARPGFVGAFPGFRVQLWAPVEFSETVFPNDGSLSRMGDRFLNLFARLSPDATISQADAQLAAVSRGLSSLEGGIEGRSFRLASSAGVHPSLRGIVTAVMSAIFAMTSLVLLVACANVANLLLARGVERGPEIATRLALGASATQLIRLLLVEATLLGLLGASIGVVLSLLGTMAFSRLQPPVGVPVGFEVSVDPSVLFFAVGAGLVSSLLFGLLPSIRGLGRGRTTLTQGWAVKDDSGRTGFLRNALLAGQVAVTCVLLVSATLFLRSLSNLATLDAGFDRAQVITVAASPDSYDESQGRAYWQDLLEAARGTPGVQTADVGLFVHLGGRSDQAQIHPADSPDEAAAPTFVNYSIAGTQFLDVVGIALVGGRGFAEEDREGNPPVAIVNQVLGNRLWPGENPIGKSLRLDVRGTAQEVAVVGVTETVKYRRFNEAPTPFLYLPFGQWYRPDMVVHARSAQDLTPLVHIIDERLSSVHPAVPIVTKRMSEHSTMDVFLARVLRVVLLVCGFMALIIATVGVSGVVWYSASRRVKEVAIRMALGANSSRVRRLLVGQTVLVLALGVGIGIVILLPAGQLLSAFMYGISPRDLGTTAGVGATLLLTGVVASWSSVRRATRTQPFEVLRGER